MSPGPKHRISEMTASEMQALNPLVSPETQQPVIVELAVEIWRLRRRLTRLCTEPDDRERLAPLEDTAQRLEDLLAQHEIETRDHDGEIWQQGSAVEVLHAREGEAPLVVVETVRPTIRISGKLVQKGQVITGPGTEPESKGISD